MKGKTWAIIIILLLIIVGTFVYLHEQWTEPLNIMPINKDFQLLGVIDMDSNHNGINLRKVVSGDDVLLVLDKNGYLTQFIPNHPEYTEYYSKPFDLVYFDPDGEGVLDSEDTLWNYLYVIIYTDDGATYQVRTLHQAGIHAILTKHITEHGDHKILLSDGDTRILYEVPAKYVDGGQ